MFHAAAGIVNPGWVDSLRVWCGHHLVVSIEIGGPHDCLRSSLPIAADQDEFGSSETGGPVAFADRGCREPSDAPRQVKGIDADRARFSGLWRARGGLRFRCFFRLIALPVPP